MERQDPRELIATDEQTPLFAYHWSGGIGQPATMFWYEGRVLLAGTGTRAEDWLLERGAIAVGSLRFDGRAQSGDRAQAAGELVTVPAAELVDAATQRN